MVKLYEDIDLPTMSRDFEEIRKKLKIDKWLVFGGSWGSALGLDYAERYPERCLGQILRGIFLSTEEEMDALYKRSTFEKTPDAARREKQLRDFDLFFDL